MVTKDGAIGGYFLFPKGRKEIFIDTSNRPLITPLKTNFCSLKPAASTMYIHHVLPLGWVVYSIHLTQPKDVWCSRQTRPFVYIKDLTVLCMMGSVKLRFFFLFKSKYYLILKIWINVSFITSFLFTHLYIVMVIPFF